MSSALILVVSADEEVTASVRRQVTALGHELSIAETLESAISAVGERAYDALLLQADSPGVMCGRQFSRSVLPGCQVPLIILARQRSIRDAVAAIRSGAVDYLAAMPLDGRLLRTAIQRALLENNSRSVSTTARLLFDGFVTADQRMLAICQVLADAADTRAPLLIEGESGTGKTLLARLVHENSCRRFGPFLEVNCGALSETLLESELFGHARGAFTSAYAERKGKFEASDGGTLLLDEVDSASAGLQMRLLRTVECGRFERLGETTTQFADVRLICTTSAALERRVAEGAFREDLYHRLNAVRVELPSLRDRVVDVPLLARHLLRQMAEQHRRKVTEFSAEVMDRLVHYSWPGNVRELRNVIERGVILARDGMITLDSLPRHLIESPRSGPQFTRQIAGAGSLRDAMREPERRCILTALQMTGWNKLVAARDLGISRSTLYKKMKEYDIEDQELPTGKASISRSVSLMSLDKAL